MNQILKLSIFLGLGCKAMKAVILHCPDWTIHVKDSTIQKLEQSNEVRRAMEYEARWMIGTVFNCKTYCKTAMSIEAIPEKLSEEEIDKNIMNIALQWKYAL